MEVSLLQYTYDPIFVGDININNVVAIKSLLRCFEIASGLKVNSLKSRFGGIKVEEEVVERYVRYLNCRILSLPFLYLGIPIGENPRWRHEIQ